MHDLLLDFIRTKCHGEDTLIETAVGRQAQYLGTLAVLRGYFGNGEVGGGLYSLIRLWRSLFELSSNEQLEVDAYNSSLGDLGEAESTDAASMFFAVGRLFELQVGSGRELVTFLEAHIESQLFFLGIRKKGLEKSS